MIASIYSLLIPILLATSSIVDPVPVEDKIQWYTWEEAIEANKLEKKKFLIDLYTDWCGWCKVMDKKTFSQKNVAKYVNEHFYAIKFDAESKKEIFYRDHNFKHLPGGRNGIHELAYSLMDGKASYPTLVYLDEEERRILISPGYKQPAQLMKELRYTEEEGYKTTPFNEFK